MRHPVTALLWECWRLSRRWYLCVLPVAIAILVFNMQQAEGYFERAPRSLVPDMETIYLLLAGGVFQMLFMLAVLTTLLAMSLGNKAGFPLSFEFRLPINSTLLVAVPMLFLAVLCSSLYFVPALLGRLLYGVPFPLLPVSMLLGTQVIGLLTSSWAMRSVSTRIASMLVVAALGLELFRWLDPWNPPDRALQALPRFTVDTFMLAPVDYGVLVALCVFLFGFTLASVRAQRCGEESLSGLLRGQERQGGEVIVSTPAFSLPALQDRLANLFSLPCPIQAPWRAELWLELTRNTRPILLFSLVLALFAPLLLALSVTSNGIGSLDYILPLAVVVTGVGYAVFNRRATTAGYMSAFEGTRGMGTVKLALIQLLALGPSCLGGIVLVCVSLYLWYPLLLDGELGEQLRALPDTLGDRSSLLLLTEVVAALVLYLEFIALLACVHICSVVWGRFLPIGMALLSLYGLAFTFAVQRGTADRESIQQHMWGFAAVVLVVTLLSLGKAFHRKLFSLGAGLATLLCWGVFLACSLYSLAGRGIVLPNQAPELQAFNAALLVLPLTLFIALIWSYDRLRHR